MTQYFMVPTQLVDNEPKTLTSDFPVRCLFYVAVEVPWDSLRSRRPFWWRHPVPQRRYVIIYNHGNLRENMFSLTSQHCACWWPSTAWCKLSAGSVVTKFWYTYTWPTRKWVMCRKGLCYDVGVMYLITRDLPASMTLSGIGLLILPGKDVAPVRCLDKWQKYSPLSSNVRSEKYNLPFREMNARGLVVKLVPRFKMTLSFVHK